MREKSGRSFFVSGGTLPAGSPSYVERGADKALLEALLAGQFCYVLNSRQMGKSSLSVHAVDRLESQGVRVALLDLTRIGGNNLSVDQWYTGLAVEVGREFELTGEVMTYWQENAALGASQRFFGVLRDVVLSSGNDAGGQRFVIFIDEIDVTKTLRFDADEFFAGIRECFNHRVSDGRFDRLTFCLVGVGVPSDLIRNRAATPFNIGERIMLEDFSLAEMTAFASALGPMGPELVKRVHHWTNGHPYLSQSLCRSIAGIEKPESINIVDEIVRRELFDFKARESNINLSDVANIALNYGNLLSGEFQDEKQPDAIERFRADLLSTYQRILEGKAVFDDDSNRVVVVLKLSGIVRSDGRRLSLRNLIYAHVFDRQWIDEHLPAQELRRQQQSYKRGMVRTAIVAGAIVGLVCMLALYGWFSRQAVLEAKNELDYRLYIADINTLRNFYEKGNTQMAQTILNRHKNSPYRNFEWSFWMGQFHDSPEEYTLDFDAPGKREQGHLSTDGKQVCIFDALSDTATVVDRATHKRIKTIQLQWDDRVITLRDRWVITRPQGPRVVLLDLITNRLMCSLEDPGRYEIISTATEHSNIVSSIAQIGHSGPIEFMNTWDVSSGKRISLYRMQSSDQALIQTSNDGRLILRAKRSGKSALEATVYDSATSAIVDRFSVPNISAPLSMSPSGEKIYFQDAESKLAVRIVRLHKSVPIPWMLPGLHSVRGLNGDAKVVMLIDGAQCVIGNADGSGEISTRGNSFSVLEGSRPNEYIASASTVRIYDAGKTIGPRIVAKGYRITRYSNDVFNIFKNGPSTIERITDGDYASIGRLPDVYGAEDLTYNGHWFLQQDKVRGQSLLVSTDRSLKPVAIPISSSIWSAGVGVDRLAFWNQNTFTMTVVSGASGKTEWSKSGFNEMNAMWLSPDSARLFVAHSRGTVTVYDAKSGAPIGSLKSHNLEPIYLGFSADQKRIFTCGGDGRVVMWDAATLKKMMDFRGNGQEVMTSADLSPDGKRVVTTDSSGSWALWDAVTGFQLLDVKVSTKPLTSALFTRDGKKILTAGDDGLVREWTGIERDPTVRIPIEPELSDKVYR